MIRKPLPAVLGEFDGTPFTGNLWTRSGTAKTGVKMTDGVPHSDVIAFLNGYGSKSGDDLTSIIQANKGSFSTFTIGLNDDGFFNMYSSSLRFAYHEQGDHRELFGFTGHEQPTSSRLTATNPWKRGNLEVISLGGSSDKKGLFVMKSSTSRSALAQSKTGPDSQGRYVLGFSTNYMSQDEYDSILTSGGEITVLKHYDGGLWRVHSKSVGQNKFDITVSAYADTRGVPSVGSSFTLGGYYWWTGTSMDILPVVRRVQNLTTWLRVRGSEADADDIYSGKCLEDFDYTSGADISWTLNGEGKVVVSWHGSQLDPLSLTRTSTGSSLMRRLGFDGSEQAEALGSYGYDNYKLTATNVCPCVLPSYKPMVELKRRVTGRIDQRVMTDGSAVSSGLRALNGWTMKLRIKGPIFGYSGDMERHLRSWWSYARRGLTVYPTFGDAENVEAGGADTRRHVNRRDVWDMDERYTLSQTVEADDESAHFLPRVGGRLLTRRSPNDSSFRSETYDQEVDAFQDITIEMIDDKSR